MTEAQMGHKSIVFGLSVVIAGSVASSALADQGGGLPALDARVTSVETETATLQSELATAQSELAVLQSQLAALQSRRAVVHTRKTSTSVAAKSFAFVETPCAQGEQVLGGGHESFVALPSAVAPQLWDSAPGIAEDGVTQVWRLGVENDNDAPMSFSVYAVCLAP
jgi:hypothetical protein